ncbi:MAG: DUF4129 domain-containing protein, partial [Gammaproteobacteria bacterium]
MNKAAIAQGAAGGDADRFEAAHAQLRSDASIQFDMAQFQPPKPPAWLEALLDFLSAASPALKIIFWLVVVIVVLLLVAAIIRRVQDGEWSWLRRKRDEAAPADWRPEEAPARALLQEADALAAAGRYGEAAHLLLFRSIE